MRHDQRGRFHQKTARYWRTDIPEREREGALFTFLFEKRCATSLQSRPGGIRDSLRQGASQAAGAAPTLRYGPAGDSAPRLRLKAAGMAERFLSARPHGPNAPVWGAMLSNAIK